MWWGVHSGMGWWMLFGSFWMVVFWAVIIVLVVWGVRAVSGRGGGEVDPLEIARRRYARGEITREQFEQIKGDLRKP